MPKNSDLKLYETLPDEYKRNIKLYYNEVVQKNREDDDDKENLIKNENETDDTGSVSTFIVVE